MGKIGKMTKQLKAIQIIGIKAPVFVSEEGKVYYNEKEKHQTLIKGKNHKHGYYQVSIENKRMYVHKLVAQAFVPNNKPVSNKIVFHKDNNTLNNHYTNLFWGSKSETYERIRQLRKEELKDPNYRGTSKISGEEAVKIAKRLDNGEKAKVICKEYGVSEMSIARIRKRYCKKKSASPRYGDDVKEMVKRLLEYHRPIDVARSTGIRYETILKWSKKYKKS